MSLRSILSLAVPVASSALLLACGGDDKEDAQYAQQQQPVQCPPGQYFDGTYCQVQGQPGTQPGTTQPGTTQPGTTDPGTAQPGGPVAVGQAGPAATPLDPTAASAATTLLQPLAQQHLPAGAKPLGSAMAGQFQPGQSLEQQVQMQPGKCYTVVAAGVPPTVQEVNIQFLPVIPIPGAAPILAQDQTTGPTAVVGAKPDCYKWAFPMAGPIKIVLTVAAGQGIAAAQVYEK